ncbi:MAG: beta propeller repeat protein, partial [Candidatus Geothermincolia bacterium]
MSLAGESTTDALVFDGSHDVLYALNSNGLWRCDDPHGSQTWQDIANSHDTSDSYSLVYDDAHNILYAVLGSGTWRIENPGATPTWTRIGSASYPGRLVYDVGHDVLYLASDGIYRCTNPGVSPAFERIAYNY